MSKPKSLRARLTLTTAMAGALLVSYGGRTSYAGTCVGAGGGVYVCSGGAVPGEAGVSIDYGGPVTVTTSSPPAGFGIDTTGTVDTAISIKADGGLTFNDTNTDGSIITGAKDGLEAINTDGGAVTITTNGPVTGLDGEGITASNSSDGTDLTISAVDVYGSQSGIKAINAGSGALEVSASGTVTGTAKYGIQAENTSVSATNLTITAANVSGGQFGVRAINLGTGTLTITATGTVTGDQFQGIAARNLGTDLTISAQGVSGVSDGILALHEGTGSLSITASGAVTGTAGYGIRAENSSEGVNLTISAAGVSGTTAGIDAKSEGTGALSIFASDQVAGGTGSGIKAYNSEFGGDLTISTNGVEGGTYGIYAYNAGESAISITAKDAVVGGTLAPNDGIDAYNGSKYSTGITIDVTSVTGSKRGIDAFNNGYGNVSIAASGFVEGTGSDGIKATNSVEGTDLTISAAGVSGATTGINALNNGTGDLTITATGAVTGQTDTGIRARNLNGGAVSIAAKGTVSGAFDGMYVRNGDDGTSLTISAAGVSGGQFGIYAKNDGTGDLSVTADGAVTGGTNDGISAKNFNGGAVSINVSDTVSSTGDDGIYAYNAAGGTSLTIAAAGVSGGQHGIYAKNEGAGDLTIAADDTVTSGDAEGIDARITNAANGGDIIITTNDVNGGATGIAARHEGTGSIEITANGTVFGGLSDNSSGGGIIAQIVNDASTGDITIAAGTVTSEQNGIEARNEGDGSVTVTADGQVTATNVNADGIRVQNFEGGDLTISAASVDADRFGIFAANSASGSILVTATGTVTGGRDDGIRAVIPIRVDGINITIDTADVDGGAHGVFAQNLGTGFVSVTAGDVKGDTLTGVTARLINGTDVSVSVGDVQGGQEGILASNSGNGSLSVTAGTVTGGLGGNGDGIFARLGTEGDDLTISAASVSGANTGINAVSEGTGALSVSTSDPVVGASADGIFAKIDNAANGADLTISANAVTGAEIGIQADHQGTGNIIISASGSVEGIGDNGITIVNTAAAGAVTIEVDAVVGGRSGIRAEHLGTGALSITAGGDVTGDTTEGIFAKIDNAASGADLTISAMGVSGGTDGIDAENLGSGSVVVTTSGPVTADGDGYGIRVGNFAGGDVSISAADTVTAPGTGIAGRNYGPMAGNVTITAAGVTGRNGIVASTQGTGSVSVTATGTVIGTAAAGGGINALNTGGTDIEISTEDVIGGARGISARNTGTGSTIIDANGTVTGLGDIALYAYNGVGGGDITVSAIDVDGGNFGILARSRAEGSISVTASGDVTGAFSDGIRADAASLNATQVTVAAQSVFGEQRGIDARNNGTDHLEVVAEGTVTGGQNEGIRARITNTDSGGDLTVSAADVSGGTYGIFAENQGSGDFRISASGTVAGTERDGIRAINSANGAGLTVSAAGVIGGDYGIFASNEGTGALSVTTTGLVSGGPYGGIVARNSNGGALGITAMDTVTSTGGAGVFGYNGIGGTALTISAAAGANGGNYGVFAENQGSGDFRISASGTVAGTERDGIRAINSANGAGLTISAASVIGGGYGIFAKNEGDAELSVTTTGLVSGGIGDGIVARNYNGGALNVTTKGTVISTGGEGIYANNYTGTTSLTISATGVSARQYGIIGRNDGSGDFTVTSTGMVTSYISAGIFAENLNGGAVSINAKDTVEATNGVGINARNLVDTTELTIVAADIDAGKEAIVALNEGTGDISITTTGPVTSATYAGIVARNFNGGALGMTAKDMVTAAEGPGMYALNGSGGTDLTISARGVSGGGDGIFAENAGSGLLSITSSGTVTGLGEDGIDARDGGTVGQGITIRAQTVHGDEYGISATGISGDISVTADETVRGERASGIRAELQDLYGTGDITVSAADVRGGNFGIIARSRADGSVSVSASGPIVGLLSAGVRADGGSANSTDVTVDVGDVSGGQRGIDTSNLGTGDLTVIADGLVTSGTREGIRAQIRNAGSGGDLTVSAVDVTGGSDGILALNRGTGALTITATGTVTGGMYSGITATIDNPDSTGDLSISAVDVGGNESGIVAENRGSGDLIVFTKGSVEGRTDDGMYLRNANGGALSVTATEHVASAELNGIRAINYAGGSSMTISTAGVSGFTGGIIATNAGTGDIAVTATGEVSGGPLGDGMRVRNLSGGSLSITTTALVSSGPSPVATGIFAENEPGGTDLSISATDVFGNRNGITARHYGDGALDVTATGSVTGATGVGIRAYNKATGSSLTVSAASVTGGTDAIQVDHQGSGDLLVTVRGAISGGTGAGINNIDMLAQGGTIEVTETASVEAASGVAVMDGNGGTRLWSEGALAGDVMLNGGADEVALIDGSATGLIGLGSGDDTMEIFGAGAGVGWDDADFSGTFDGNLGQVLQIDGGDGVDTVELFGVTAASQALGVPTGLEALALSANALVQANDADLTPFGAVFVDPSSTLQAEGNSPSNTVVGSLGNEGVVDLADGEANDVLRVTGDYAGATGSQVSLDFDADGATSDMFIIEGDVTDVSVGPFTVVHDGSLIDVNLIGRGSRTTGDGIRLIEVSGAVDGDDFALAGPVEGDLFGYELVFEDGAHFLRSDFFDQIYLYENLPGAMQTIGLALTGQLVERVGVRSAVPSALADADSNPVSGGAPVDTAIWGRAVGLSVESEGDLNSVTGTSFDQTVGFLQAGVDVTVLERQSGRLLIGALGHWGTSSLDANTFDGDDAGSANFDFYGGGLTATWYSTQGWYFDNVVQYTAYDIDISTASRFSTTSTDGYAITTSHEVGYRIPISETAALVPQAQLTYQHIDFDDFTDPDGVRISLDDGDSLIGRAGFAFENSAAIGSALATGYVEANVLHEFLGDNSVNVATGFGMTPISQEARGTSVELGFGGTVAVSRGVSLYAEVDYTIPFDNGVQGVQALGGIRVNLNPPPPPPLPAPVIAPVAETAFIVFFDWDRADLTSEANLVLDDVVVVANQSGYASIRLDGYTDLSGSAAYNLGLSERRANAVANGLIARGIAPDEIVIRAFGEENPLVPTPDGVREPQNRRVEIFLS